MILFYDDFFDIFFDILKVIKPNITLRSLHKEKRVLLRTMGINKVRYLTLQTLCNLQVYLGEIFLEGVQTNDDIMKLRSLLGRVNDLMMLVNSLKGEIMLFAATCKVSELPVVRVIESVLVKMDETFKKLSSFMRQRYLG
jgi:hypothetical protein